METKLYSAKELSLIFEEPVKTTYNRISVRGIGFVKKIKGINYYALSQFDKKVETVVVYYPIKTIENFYIYQSKMNKK